MVFYLIAEIEMTRGSNDLKKVETEVLKAVRGLNKTAYLHLVPTPINLHFTLVDISLSVDFNRRVFLI